MLTAAFAPEPIPGLQIQIHLNHDELTTKLELISLFNIIDLQGRLMMQKLPLAKCGVKWIVEHAES